MTGNRLTRFSFRISPAERQKIIADATANGMKTGSYIRSRLLDAPQTRTVYRRTLLKRLIVRLVGQIGRVGNNMNQIAHKLNGGAVLAPIDGQSHAEGITALKEMRAALISFMIDHDPC